MGNLITVSRQFGSLGRPIAKAVAEKMGYEFLDPEIIEKAAQRMGKEVDELIAYDNQVVIKSHLDGSKYINMAYPFGFADSYKQKQLYKIETKIMEEEVENRDCVIVGRAADYLFSKVGKKNLFRVHITAPYEYRYEQSVNSLQLTRVEATEHIKIIDKARGLFYKQVTGEDFDSPLYRDIILNMEYIEFDEAVELICNMAQKRF